MVIATDGAGKGIDLRDGGDGRRGAMLDGEREIVSVAAEVEEGATPRGRIS